MEELTKTTQTQATIKILNIRYSDGLWSFNVVAEKKVEIGKGREVKIIVEASIVDKYMTGYTVYSDVDNVEKALFPDEYKDFKKKTKEFLEEIREILQVQ